MAALFLHIGAHKTGSTYIQQRLTADADRLRRDHGIVYPTVGRELLWGHHNLCKIISGGGDLGELRKNLVAETKSASTILLSSENFEGLNEKNIRRLISLFDPDSVKVLFFFRNWTPLLYSMWQEEIKHGEIILYHQYIESHLVFYFSSKLLNFELAVSEYASVVGKDNVLLASYDNIIGTGDDLYAAVLKQLGIDGASWSFSPAAESSPVNASFDPYIVEAIRMMNAMALQEGYKKSHWTKHYYVNTAMQGEGRRRHNRLAGTMARYTVPTKDYSRSYGAKMFFQGFLDNHANHMIDNPASRTTYVNKPVTKLASIVHQDYLLEPGVLEDLRAAWIIVRRELRRHPEFAGNARSSEDEQSG